MAVITLARWSRFPVTVVALLVFAAWWRRIGALVEPQFSLARLTSDVALFVAFAGHHSLFARRSAKALVATLSCSSSIKDRTVWSVIRCTAVWF